MDIGTFRGIVTAILLIAFLGLIAWAWSRRRKADFDEAAQLPFADDELVARSFPQCIAQSPSKAGPHDSGLLKHEGGGSK
ncbi:CcoQ/FixQ family Cbb3-type cytochrome c oxidase assembly chaperone [Halomonas huangheensis]|uniref:Cytochrome oxidase n=1 Tax=Halomonas huangheensis TaxID=1178482 RepID=W1N3G0_9GAMM|nr:CcoQ/FixQ family Cbb3-type cytochrome c oxidase assembly chaperone [Halomonas huangheensis]ALM51578.1 hypothetical protein AR456_04190 [Halomonas huangheensis]ERL50058.1 hypothetical protein BJB45_02705 [Halomonas huangheensis]